MINVTDVVLVNWDSDLNVIIRDCVKSTLVHLEKKYGPEPVKVVWRGPHGFQYLFSQRNVLPSAEFGLEFINAAFEFLQTGTNQKGAGEFTSHFLTYSRGLKPGVMALGAIRQGLKILMVELWAEGVIMLPTIFNVGTHFKPIRADSELEMFVNGFDATIPSVDLQGVAEEDARRIFYYMPRILRATNWKSVEDVNINQLAKLHHSQRQYIAGNYQYSIVTSPVPWTLFLNMLQNAFPTRVQFSIRDIETYSKWIHSRTSEALSIAEHREHEASKKLSAASPRIKIHREEINAKKKQENNAKFETIAQARSHEDALMYFQSFTARTRIGYDKNEVLPSYPGREHIDLSGLSAEWLNVIKAFIHHRKFVQGYEGDAINSSLNILADYLFLYLPWWKELYPDSKLVLPRVPKDFTRYPYIYRSSPVGLSEAPLVLFDLVKLRRLGKTTQYSTMVDIYSFFNFIAENYAENELVAGKKFLIPIRRKLDIPRGSKPKKTTKVAFCQDASTYLTQYGYAVEGFGEYLLDRCISNEFYEQGMVVAPRCFDFNSEELGYVPIVWHRGRAIPIQRVPNVFLWASRMIRSQDGNIVSAYIPHLTTLRVLVANNECGLRLAGIRWLHKHVWDGKNHRGIDDEKFSYSAKNHYFYPVEVSTDKTKDAEWSTDFVFRLRSLILREEKFQNQVQDMYVNVAVPYEGREHSRFGEIVPVFRSHSSAKPVNPSICADYWIYFLLGFQSFYKDATGRMEKLVYYSPTKKAPGKSDVIVGEDGEYMPIALNAISTPHSGRVTFVTNRSGLMDVTGISETVGHQSESCTIYYSKPRSEDLRTQLESADRHYTDDWHRFDSGNEVHIRADKESSSLVTSFRNDRSATLQAFGFMAPLSLWQSADSGSMAPEEIALLRDGPMSLVRFRDTNICPVGEECPSEIVTAIGGFRRCGLCPLAMKCIDHLPAIAAKMKLLLERIRYLKRKLKSLRAAEEIAAEEEVWSEMELDTNEFLGWKLSEEVLLKIYEQRDKRRDENDLDVQYLVGEPEIVKRHLQYIAKDTGAVEFLLMRIADANAYPSMKTPQLAASAALIRKKIMAGTQADNFIAELDGDVDIVEVAGLLKSVGRAHQISWQQMAERLQTVPSFTVSNNLLMTSN